MYTIYKHTTPDGKVYIGVTNRPLKLRFRNGTGYLFNKSFVEAIKHFGWENISHDILYTCEDAETAYSMEIENISKYKSNNPEFGYNVTCGGTGVRMPCSEITKKRISDSNKGKIRSEEVRNRISVSMLGKKNSLGKQHSTSTKQKIGMANSKSMQGNRNGCKRIYVYQNDELLYEFSSRDECAKFFNVPKSYISEKVAGTRNPKVLRDFTITY